MEFRYIRKLFLAEIILQYTPEEHGRGGEHGDVCKDLKDVDGGGIDGRSNDGFVHPYDPSDQPQDCDDLAPCLKAAAATLTAEPGHLAHLQPFFHFKMLFFYRNVLIERRK